MVVQMSKRGQDLRRQRAALSFTEKVKILEKLRDRSLVIAAGLRRRENAEHDAGRRFCSCLGWEPCGCGHQPPYHCRQCSQELTEEQIEAARARGWYPKLVSKERELVYGNPLGQINRKGAGIHPARQ